MSTDLYGPLLIFQQAGYHELVIPLDVLNGALANDAGHYLRKGAGTGAWNLGDKGLVENDSHST